MLSKLNYYNIQLSALAIVVLFALVLLQIILRLFNWYIPSLNEICGYLLVSSFFLALGYSFCEDKHIRVSLLFELNNPSISHLAQVISYVAASLLSVFISYACLNLTLDSFTHGEVSSGELPILEWPFQAVMTYSSVLFSLTIMTKGLGVLRGNN